MLLCALICVLGEQATGLCIETHIESRAERKYDGSRSDDKFELDRLRKFRRIIRNLQACICKYSNFLVLVPVLVLVFALVLLVHTGCGWYLCNCRAGYSSEIVRCDDLLELRNKTVDRDHMSLKLDFYLM